MISIMAQRRNTFSYRIFSAFIALTFLLSIVLPPRMAFAQFAPTSVLNLPVPGTMVSVSTGFMPALMTGVSIHPDNPLRFDFIMDRGQSGLEGESLKAEYTKLIKYFMASLTVPEDELWVNLSPYEKDRMIAQGLGQTEMGRDMLAQDYLLKQLTASLMYPEEELGKKFWDKIYKIAKEKYGTTEIPVNTFNKVWIVPDEALVYEQEIGVPTSSPDGMEESELRPPMSHRSVGAFVIKSRLAVMLEEDYVASRMRTKDQRPKTKGLIAGKDSTAEGGSSVIGLRSSVSTEIIREVIIPEIEKEINEGKNFANLRQIYNALILAVWYKQRLKDSLLGKVYVDQNKTKGIDTQDKEINQKIYNQYIESFKKGVYNFIKEDYDPVTQEIIPRKYFSGGARLTSSPIKGDLKLQPLHAPLGGWKGFVSGAFLAFGLSSFNPEDVSVAMLGDKQVVVAAVVDVGPGAAPNVQQEGIKLAFKEGQAPNPLLIRGPGETFPDARFDDLVKILKEDSDSSLRSLAATYLGSSGNPEAVEPLMEALKWDKDPIVRWAAINALGNFSLGGDDLTAAKVVRSLIGALKDEHADVRESASYALRGFDLEAVPLFIFIEALNDPDRLVREKVVEFLDWLGDGRAVEPLIEVMKTDKDPVVRRNAARALGKLGNESALRPLLETMKHDEDPLVRRHAAEALEELGGVDAPGRLMASAQGGQGPTASSPVAENRQNLDDRISRLIAKITQEQIPLERNSQQIEELLLSLQKTGKLNQDNEKDIINLLKTIYLVPRPAHSSQEVAQIIQELIDTLLAEGLNRSALDIPLLTTLAGFSFLKNSVEMVKVFARAGIITDENLPLTIGFINGLQEKVKWEYRIYDAFAALAKAGAVTKDNFNEFIKLFNRLAERDLNRGDSDADGEAMKELAQVFADGQLNDIKSDILAPDLLFALLPQHDWHRWGIADSFKALKELALASRRWKNPENLDKPLLLYLARNIEDDLGQSYRSFGRLAEKEKLDPEQLKRLVAVFKDVQIKPHPAVFINVPRNPFSIVEELVEMRVAERHRIEEIINFVISLVERAGDFKNEAILSFLILLNQLEEPQYEEIRSGILNLALLEAITAEPGELVQGNLIDLQAELSMWRVGSLNKRINAAQLEKWTASVLKGTDVIDFEGKLLIEKARLKEAFQSDQKMKENAHAAWKEIENNKHSNVPAFLSKTLQQKPVLVWNNMSNSQAEFMAMSRWITELARQGEIQIVGLPVEIRNAKFLKEFSQSGQVTEAFKGMLLQTILQGNKDDIRLDILLDFLREIRSLGVALTALPSGQIHEMFDGDVLNMIGRMTADDESAFRIGSVAQDAEKGLKSIIINFPVFSADTTMITGPKVFNLVQANFTKGLAGEPGSAATYALSHYIQTNDDFIVSLRTVTFKEEKIVHIPEQIFKDQARLLYENPSIGVMKKLRVFMNEKEGIQRLMDSINKFNHFKHYDFLLVNASKDDDRGKGPDTPKEPGPSPSFEIEPLWDEILRPNIASSPVWNEIKQQLETLIDAATTQDELKRIYRKMAHTVHPDKVAVEDKEIAHSIFIHLSDMIKTKLDSEFNIRQESTDAAKSQTNQSGDDWLSSWSYTAWSNADSASSELRRREELIKSRGEKNINLVASLIANNIKSLSLTDLSNLLDITSKAEFAKKLLELTAKAAITPGAMTDEAVWQARPMIEKMYSLRTLRKGELVHFRKGSTIVRTVILEPILETNSTLRMMTPSESAPQFLEITQEQLIQPDLDLEREPLQQGFEMNIGEIFEIDLSDFKFAVREKTTITLYGVAWGQYAFAAQDVIHDNLENMRGHGLGIGRSYALDMLRAGKIRKITPSILTLEKQHPKKSQKNIKGPAASPVKTILVVDDSNGPRFTSNVILSGAGYKVITAEDAETALKVLEKTKIDLVISDLNMQGKNGIELAQEIGELYPGLSVILTSVDFGGLTEALKDNRPSNVADTYNKTKINEYLSSVVGKFLKAKDSSDVNKGPAASQASEDKTSSSPVDNRERNEMPMAAQFFDQLVENFQSRGYTSNMSPDGNYGLIEVSSNVSIALEQRFLSFHKQGKDPDSINTVSFVDNLIKIRISPGNILYQYRDEKGIPLRGIGKDKENKLYAIVTEDFMWAYQKETNPKPDLQDLPIVFISETDPKVNQVNIIAQSASSPVKEDSGNRGQYEEIIRTIFDRVKRDFNIDEDIPLTDRTIKSYLPKEDVADLEKYANVVFQAMTTYFASTKVLRERQVQPTKAQQDLIETTQRLIRERSERLGIAYRNPPIVFVPREILKHVLGLFNEFRNITAFYSTTWPTIFISNEEDISSLGNDLIHEMLHANSTGLPETLLEEGVTEYFAIKTRLYREGKTKITALDVAEYLSVSAADYKVDYQWEVMTILGLISRLRGEGPIVEAYFKGNYSSLETMKEWPGIVQLAHQYRNSQGFEERHEWYNKTMQLLGLPSASSPIVQELESPAKSENLGGIDLNPALLDLQIKRDDNGVPLPLFQQPIETMHIEGFLPVIINIVPIANLPLLLGLDLPAQEDPIRLSYQQLSMNVIQTRERFYIREPEEIFA